jgi:hypothetical protein
MIVSARFSCYVVPDLSESTVSAALERQGAAVRAGSVRSSRPLFGDTVVEADIEGSIEQWRAAIVEITRGWYLGCADVQVRAGVLASSSDVVGDVKAVLGIAFVVGLLFLGVLIVREVRR